MAESRPDAGRALARELDDLARTLRGALASLRAATELLERLPEADTTRRERLFGVVAEETGRLGELADRLETLSESAPRPAVRRRTTAAELIAALRTAGDALGVPWADDEGAESLPDASLDADVDALGTASAEWLAALRREFDVSAVTLRARRRDGYLLVDWLWRPESTDAERLRDWPGEALEATVRPVARDHGGEAWFNLDRAGDHAYVRLLLPVVVDER